MRFERVNIPHGRGVKNIGILMAGVLFLPALSATWSVWGYWCAAFLISKLNASDSEPIHMAGNACQSSLLQMLLTNRPSNPRSDVLLATVFLVVKDCS